MAKVVRKVKTTCPICGQVLRWHVWKDVPDNACKDHPELMICSEVDDCVHYKWVRVSSLCWEEPDVAPGICIPKIIADFADPGQV